MALPNEPPNVQGRDLNRTHDVTRPVQTAQPRIDCTNQDWRQANDYVRTPCQKTPPDSHRIFKEPKSVHPVQNNAQSSRTEFPLVEVNVTGSQQKERSPRLPSKHKQNGSNVESTSGSGCKGSSICPRCHRCRCEKCKDRRELPRSWCCSRECSAKSAVDWVSCMCCIRGTFYHCCTGAEEENDLTDHPCGCCNYSRCFVRWIFIIVLTLFLPCLICYWPLRGVLYIVTQCYNDCGPGGCRCDRNRSGSRPLIEAENCSV